MESFDSVIEVIHEAISGYLEVFTTKEDVERAIKEDMSVSSRCMPYEQECLSDTCVYCGKPAKKMVYWGRAY